MLPPAIVDTRREYQHLFNIYVPIAVGVFGAIVGLVAFAIIRYRKRPAHDASRREKADVLESAYAIALIGVVAFLLAITYAAEHLVDTVSARERPALTIDVIGAKWEWTFYYHGYHILRRSGTTGRQPVVVPTNEPVRFDLTSEDVIHSFWIPQLRFKRDLFAGVTERVTLDFDTAGHFQGQCAEFCGLRHADMVFTIYAVSPARFRRWARSPQSVAA